MNSWLSNFDASMSSIASYMERTPSLSQTSDSATDTVPPTPYETSPRISAQQYSIPQDMDAVALQPSMQIPLHQFGPHTLLPDIMNPETASSVPIRSIVCIGAGYVGGPTAAVIALHNPHVRVTVVDRDQKRIDAWKGKHLPIHEPGLTEVVRAARDGQKEFRESRNENDNTTTSEDDGCNVVVAARQPNLLFSTACAEAIGEADMVLISVNTPTKTRGQGAGRATDMTAFEGATRDVALYARAGTILVEKSTVPCKTGQLMKDILEEHRPGVIFPILSNPEFLSEGTAIKDLMKPDRVIIGNEQTVSGCRAAAALVNLYAAWVPRERIMPINIWSSELTKLAANAFLAQRISSINSISVLCEATGADVSEIAKAVGMDKRIGSQFLKAGLGFGGSCFRKDIASLTYLAERLGKPEVAAYWQQVLTMNNFQRDRFAMKVISSLNNSLRGKKIAILGFAFKKDTDDARESPALDVIRILLEENPKSIAIYDPLCSAADIQRELRVLEGGNAVKPDGPVEILPDPYNACRDSNAVLVLTDWDMFKVAKIVAPTSETKQAEAEFDEVVSSAPTDILNLPQTFEHTHIEKPPTPPESPKPSHIPHEVISRLLPEPECPADCVECVEAAAIEKCSQKDFGMPLDWASISRIVKEPRWVFDGRGVLVAQAMMGMGFRLETLGRASMY